MVDEAKPSCPNCEKEGEKPMYYWRKIKLCKYNTTKEIDGIEIYCPRCERTISVMPYQEFFAD